MYISIHAHIVCTKWQCSCCIFTSVPAY